MRHYFVLAVKGRLVSITVNTWRRSVVVLVAISLISALALSRSKDSPVAAAADPIVGQACRAQALADPAVWEESLPQAQVSSDLAASDPGCVTEVGRTANSVTWSTPDGQLATRTYSHAVNFKDSSGDWSAIDTRLVPDAGGVTNSDGPFDANFADSSTDPALATLSAGNRSVGFGLDGAEAPSGGVVAPAAVDGSVTGAARDSITYADALPGVDVTYKVLASGVKEDLVLDQPLEAGIKPEFRFSISTDGLSPVIQEDGSVDFVDGPGKVAFSIPVGLAFDAVGQSTPVHYELANLAGTAKATLIVSVAAEWLNSTDRTYPVTIDPTVTVGALEGSDAFVADGAGHTTTNYSGWGQLDTSLGQFVDNVGYSGENFRSFQSFDFSQFTGAYIVSATWKGYAFAVQGTTPAAVTLRPVSTAWSPTAVTWATRPSVLATSATSGGYTGSGWQSAGITSWVRNYLSGAWEHNYGFELRGPSNARVQLAASYNDASLWSYVDIVYDALPKSSRVRAEGLLDSVNVNDSTPTLSAQVDDSDTPNGVYEHYTIYDTAKANVVVQGDGSPVHAGERSAWTVGDSTTTWASPGATSLADGTYWYLARSHDGTTWGPPSWIWNKLVVDTSAPNAPSASSSTWTASTWNSSAPATGTFTFGSPGSTDVASYAYGLDANDTPSEEVSATSATATITPDTGWHDLLVRSQDAAGNLSAATHVTFGQGAGGFVAPEPDAGIAKNLVVSLDSSMTYDGVTVQYRRGETDSWTDIPAADVTVKSTGSGIGSWPVQCTGWTSCTGTDRHTYPSLVWNAESTLGSEGAVQIQAVYWIGSTKQTVVSTTRNLTFDPNQFGGGYASAPMGPGSVNLLTGNFALGAIDVSFGGLGVERSFNSRDTAASGFFGPGWTSSVTPGDDSYTSLSDSTTDVVIAGSDQGITTFRRQADGSYKPQDGAEFLTLTKCSASGTNCDTNANDRFELSILSFETWGFTKPTGASVYELSDVTGADGGTGKTTWQVASGMVRPTQQVAAPPAGVTCTSPLTTRGCRTVQFTYATTTTASGATLGNYAGQLQKVSFTAWDPQLSGGSMSTVDVVQYAYDDTGHLREAWDPRITPSLKTAYTYNAYGQVATLTPPGLQPWTFNYAPISGETAGTGRLANVQRPILDGSGAVNGTSTTTVVYRIPLTTAVGGPYNMDSGTIAAWGQQDLPVDATAIYPPSQVPSGTPPTSYTRATVTYMNIDGQAVNIAQPGGGITTTEHDDIGRDIRTLTPSNRAAALAVSSTDTALQAAEARQLDTTTTYDADGLPTDTYGPAHAVDTPTGGHTQARAHVHNTYDEGAPGGATFGLVTTSTESARPTDRSAEFDARTTSNLYALGSDTSGWTLGTPLQTIVDPGSSPHLNLKTTTLYDTTTGLLTERRLPAGPSGGDAHATLSIYYTSGTNPSDSRCSSHPEWAGLPCIQQPAAQPGTSGLPDLPTTYVESYNMYGRPLVTKSMPASGATALRTDTTTYDAGGRPTTQAESAALGTAIPTVTTTYDTSTGLALTTQTTTGGTQTITRTYDALGRMTTYTDASANTSTYTYDALDRLSTINDGKATTTYTYDDVGGEKRGLPTTISDAAVGAFTATYDPDGRLATQTYPGGLKATYTYDPAGETTNVAYSKAAGSTWPASPTTYNIHGQATSMSSSLWAYTYAYDAAGRLTKTNETNVFGCVQRDYGFDADTNRTSLTLARSLATNASPANCPPDPAGATATTASYDSADRITGTGYTYDALGRTTAIPANASPNNVATSISYFTNDLANVITQGTNTRAYALDPGRRHKSWNDGTNTHTSHYIGDGDSPRWTSETTGGSMWTRYVQGFNGLAATTTSSGSITLNLTNTHGDIVAPSLPADSNWDLTVTQTQADEYGNNATRRARFDYLGSHERQRDDLSGLTLMGARTYSPALGRFLQKDPVTGGSRNSYEYAAGDGVNNRDLDGRCTVERWWVGTSVNNALVTLCGGFSTATVYFSLRLTELYSRLYWHDGLSEQAVWKAVCTVSTVLRKTSGGSVGACTDTWLQVGGYFGRSLKSAMGSDYAAKDSGHAESCLSMKGFVRDYNVYGIRGFIQRGSWGYSATGLGGHGSCNASNINYLQSYPNSSG